MYVIMGQEFASIEAACQSLSFIDFDGVMEEISSLRRYLTYEKTLINSEFEDPAFMAELEDDIRELTEVLRKRLSKTL